MFQTDNGIYLRNYTGNSSETVPRKEEPAMNNLREKFRHILDGRYGVDDLGRFILYAALIMLLISAVIRNYVLSLVITIVVVYGLVRTFSRDYARRYEENRRYLEACEKARELFYGSTRNIRDREHAYFYCPRCHQLVRVPKGKGHIMIHCPKCGTDFEKKT